jgi:TetR/AcrR family transcriptional repressor of nem operon
MLDKRLIYSCGYWKNATTLDEAQERGDIKNVDTKTTASAMFAYMEGIMLMAKTQNDPEVIKNLGPAVANIRL